MTTELQEHYVIVGELYHFYLAHFSPPNGKDLAIAKHIYKTMYDTELEKKLKFVVCDGTASMTGHTNPCIANLEKILNRPMQWIICLLHCNQLPLRQYSQPLMVI